MLEDPRADEPTTTDITATPASDDTAPAETDVTAPAETAPPPPRSRSRAKRSAPAPDAPAPDPVPVSDGTPAEATTADPEPESGLADATGSSAPGKKSGSRSKPGATSRATTETESTAQSEGKAKGAGKGKAGGKTKKRKSESADGPETAGARDAEGSQAAAPEDIPDPTPEQATEQTPGQTPDQTPEVDELSAAATGVALLFQAPDVTPLPARSGDQTAREPETVVTLDDDAGSATDSDADDAGDDVRDDTGDDAEEAGGSTSRRRRRRGGRRRRKGSSDSGEAAGDEPVGAEALGGASGDQSGVDTKDSQDTDTDAEASEGSGSSRRRRRRRRTGDDAETISDDSTEKRSATETPGRGAKSTKSRAKRDVGDEITGVTGSTRLEAKKQRRREGREAGRRRAPIVSEAEFLARRESVERKMVVRQREELTQIAVLEDKVLVEHYVARESQTSLIGNVYLGRVQNVLPSMEAAFIDIGKGRNAVLYAGEVNWSALGHPEGQPRKIESVLSSGQAVLVQVTKDPLGHKGARLTGQISLAGRFLVYVPDGTTSGISRKLPDTERNRLKALLKEIVPDTAGVIVRTAAEGASEDELTRDVERLKAQWDDIEQKAKGGAPKLLYGEPDLTLKVVRDLFTEDFTSLVVEGDEAWETVRGYVGHVAPDLEARLERFGGSNSEGDGSDPQDDAGVKRGADRGDAFTAYRIDEQIAKGLDRKVWLPSGGSLVIDRTEAMTVVDVNTGKFTGSGGNLEETVTKNNLEAAEEIVRQLRLRDIGGIIVIDFIDMVLESNRDLVLRRLVECLGRDRTRHQVAEVTSLGLVQMTRKRIGTGLVEAFSESCEHCQGRGLVLHEMPVEPRRVEEDNRRSTGRRGRSRGRASDVATPAPRAAVPTPRDVAAAAARSGAAERSADAEPALEDTTTDQVEAQVEALVEALVDAPADEPMVESVDAPVDELVTDTVDSPTDVSTDETGPEAALDTVSIADEAVEPAPVLADPVGTMGPADREPDPAPPAPAAAEPPRVVTRSRRRSASRPAGPPVASGAADTGSAGVVGAVDGASGPSANGGPTTDHADTEGGHEGGHEVAHVEHVPIKRKGARKR